jgi:hypothetical protein
MQCITYRITMIWPPLKHSFDAIEQRVTAAGVNMAEVCRRAEIQHTTWWRWKTGKAQPRKRAWEKLLTTVRGIEEERAAAQREAGAPPLDDRGVTETEANAA